MKQQQDITIFRCFRLLLLLSQEILDTVAVAPNVLAEIVEAAVAICHPIESNSHQARFVH